MPAEIFGDEDRKKRGRQAEADDCPELGEPRPDAAWVAQQSPNLGWKLEGSSIRFVIHDHDAKFADSADAVFRAEGMRVIKTPIGAPRANAHIERQIGTGRQECPDWVVIIGRRHLERVMREWIEHYNEARPRRSLD